MARLAASLARWAARQQLARLEEKARRNRVLALVILIPGIPMVFLFGILFVVLMIVVAQIAATNSGGCGTSSPTITPATNVQTSASEEKTAGSFVRYFESAGISANGSAGIVGNFWQESQLGTVANNLAEWGGSWFTTMTSWVSSHGMNPTSAQGQLAYTVFDLRTTYGWLLARLNAAPDPATAATMFETGYEKCSGVTGFMQVVPNSKCNDPNRRGFAAQALHAAGGSGGGTPVSAVVPGACVLSSASANGYVNPLAHVAGLVPERIDMGVDYAGTGEVDAIGSGTMVNVCDGGCGWPGISFIEEQLNGGSQSGHFWYAAECIIPVVSTGDVVKAGQKIGTMVNCGSGTEWGWAADLGTSTLAEKLHQQAPSGDPGAVSTAAGASASRFLQATGAPPGVMQQGGPQGTMPAGYP